MASTETSYQYRMTGFGDFLEWRTVRFVEPLPKIRVCRLCGVVASAVRLLPCTHVLCEACESQAIDAGGQCPIEGASFLGEDVQTLPFSMRDLGERQLRCFNCTDDNVGCTFTGKLTELEQHFVVDCLYGWVLCSKCEGQVIRKNILKHYQKCKGIGLGSGYKSSDGKVSFDMTEASRLAAALREIREGLKGALLNDPTGDAKIAALQHKANALVSFLDALDPQRSPTDTLLHRINWSSKESGMATICKFQGVDSMRKAHEPLLTLEQPRVLQGYTFNLSCKFERSWSKIANVSLVFTLCVGDKDDVVDWPFAKQLKLKITHVKKDANDILAPIKATPDPELDCFKRPEPDVPQNAVLTEKVSWKLIEKNDLVYNDCLFVAVAFE
ncbi:hypothetical protein V5799_014640 [Amblyomma americanum]|uniref:TRAF1-6 MATH domain-containing protein n=1 Tax=Amblyomma americanum TaxID=6943 RepID=A0AAQ4E2G0_AMBAM